MKWICVWVAGAFVLAGYAAGAGVNVRYLSTDSKIPTEVALQTFGDEPQGVLMLVGGNRRSAQQKNWIKFAVENQLALCEVRLTIRPPAKVIVPNRKPAPAGPKWEERKLPARSAEALIAAAVEQLRLVGKPWYLYASWDGADLGASLATGKLGKVAAWACNGAGTFDKEARELPYGIVASGDLDGPSYDRARDYVEQMRRRGQPLVWISRPGRSLESLDLERFVQGCFTVLIKATGKFLVVDNERKAEVSKVGADSDLARTSVLPDATMISDWAALHEPSEVVTETVATGVKEYPTLVLVLRLPRGRSNQQIFAYSYHLSMVDEVVKRARDANTFWNRFARERDIAVLTWNVKTIWSTLESYDQIGSRDINSQSKKFDAIARAWEVGVVKLAKRYQLRDSNILLYGCSRGANFAVRLAMRQSSRISVLVAHVANSFERPSPQASRLVWAMTNGELDPGVANAKRYYEQCRAFGLPVFLRFFPGLAHDENEESLQFSAAFFDHFISEEGRNKNAIRELPGQLREPRYVADLTNYLVFPASKKDAVPPEQRIAIPDRRLAELWGRFPDAAREPREIIENGERTSGDSLEAHGTTRDSTRTEESKKSDAIKNTLKVAHSASPSTKLPKSSEQRRGEVKYEGGVAQIFYNEDDRVSKIQYATGEIVIYSYDSAGKVSLKYEKVASDPVGKLPAADRGN